MLGRQKFRYIVNLFIVALVLFCNQLDYSISVTGFTHYWIHVFVYFVLKTSLCCNSNLLRHIKCSRKEKMFTCNCEKTTGDRNG